MSPATRSAPEDAPIEASAPFRPRHGAWALAGRWGGAALGAVFLVAAYAKLLDPGALVEQVRAEGLEILLPAPAIAVLALLLEIGLGLLLLLGVRPRAVLWPATALVAFFLFLTGRAYLRALSGVPDEGHGCGCFGNLIERTPAEAFWWDAALLLPTLALAWVAPPPDWAPTPWRRIAVASLLTAGLLVFAGLAPDLPLDDLATRLKPGLTVTEVCAGRDEKRACLLDAIPLLGEGRHFVVLADVDAPAFSQRIAEFNDHALTGREPLLWVLSSASAEHLQAFQLRTGATFPLQTSPKSLLRPLYRRLPRAFLVQDGAILRTWSEIPPLSQLPSPQGG